MKPKRYVTLKRLVENETTNHTQKEPKQKCLMSRTPPRTLRGSTLRVVTVTPTVPRPVDSLTQPPSRLDQRKTTPVKGPRPTIKTTTTSSVSGQTLGTSFIDIKESSHTGGALDSELVPEMRG